MKVSSTNGVLKKNNIQEVLEYFPFSEISAEEKSDFLNEEEFFVARIIEEKEVKYLQNGRVIHKENSEFSKDWVVIHKDKLNRYKIAGESIYENSKDKDPENLENDKVCFISSKDFMKLEVDGCMTLYKDDKNWFSPTINPQDFKSSQQKCRLVKYSVYPSSSDVRFLQLAQDKVISTPITISNIHFDSDNWDLEKVLELIIDSPNMEFLYKKSYSSFQKVNKSDPQQVQQIITSVPYYNQNESNNKYSVSAVFIPAHEHVVEMMKNTNKSYNARFDWIEAFLPENVTLKEVKKLLSGEDIVLTIYPDVLQHSKIYQDYLEKQKPVVPEELPKVSKSRFRTD